MTPDDIKYGFKIVYGPINNMASLADPSFMWTLDKPYFIDEEYMMICRSGLHFSLSVADAWSCAHRYLIEPNVYAPKKFLVQLVKRVGLEIIAWQSNHSIIKDSKAPIKVCTNGLKVLAVRPIRDFWRKSYEIRNSSTCSRLEHKLCDEAGLDYSIITSQLKNW